MQPLNSIRNSLFRLIFGPMSVVVVRVLTGARFEGRSNAFHFRRLTRRSGGIVVCNHTYYLDVAFPVWALWPRRPFYTSQMENFSLPVAGRILSNWDAVGVVRGAGAREIFNAQMRSMFQERKSVVIYPEGNLRLFERELQPFHKGAFHVAVSEQVPILPIVATPELRQRRWGRPRRGMRVEVLPMVCPPPKPASDTYAEAVTQLRDNVFEMMSARMAALPKT